MSRQADDSNDHNEFARLAVGGEDARVALSLIYERYARKFLAYLARRGFTTEECEDIVQEAFIKLARMGAKAADIKQPRAYLWRTLSNCSTDLLRARQRSPREAKPSEQTGDDGAIDMDLFTHKDCSDADDDGFLSCFQGALNEFTRLNPEAASTIEMAVIEGLSGVELAEALQRTYGATREFLSQCRKKFAAILSDLCYDYLPDSMRAEL